MNLNRRNKKVAISRWTKIHEKEKSIFETSKTKLYLKARICGYLAGDGNIEVRKENATSGHYGIRFFPDHYSLINPFCDAFKEIYKRKPTINKYRNYFIIGYFSKAVVEDILKTTKFGILTWRAPFNILINKRTKSEWLRAIFDSEGYVGNDHIKIQSVNARGINDVRKLLYDFGIKTKRYEYLPKNHNWNRVYILMILRKEDKIKFMKKIGFNHMVKKMKLDRMLRSPN